VIQATLILVLVYCAAKALPGRSAAERYVLWAAAFGAAALLPILSVWLGAWQPAWARTVADAFPPIVRTTSPGVSSYGADIVVRAGSLEDAERPFVRVVVSIWMLGTSLALLALVAGAVRLARLAKLARPITHETWDRLTAEVSHHLRIRRPVRLLQSPAVPIPLTWGLWRPRVVLPLDAEQWSPDLRRAVLSHELAHVRRCDWLVQILAAVVCTVYWFHPLFWLAYRRLREESEHACDDVVVNLGVDAQDYAAHLLHIVRAARTNARANAGNNARNNARNNDSAWRSALSMARSSQLEQRFAALLVSAGNRRPISGRRVAAVAVLTVAFVIPLAAMGLEPFVDATIQVQTARLPPAPDARMTSVDMQPTSAIRRVRTVDVSTADGVITAPDVVEYTTPPLYSDDARRRHLEGTVTVEARIGADGHVTAPRVVDGLGFGLDQNALVALRQWQFRPGTQGGRPVDMTVDIDIEFNLRNEALNELIANDMATRIGPDVTAPRIIRRVNLPSARDAGVERRAGTVVLDVVLLEDGKPKIVRILQALTPQLDERAIDAFEQWRFSPAMKAGRPVKVRLQADVTFR
jgi:TonB family protein